VIVAALHDVHGNLPALAAVLADPAFAEAEAVVVGGDVVAGPMAGGVLERLQALGPPVRWVRGNADREVVAAFDAGDADPADHAGDPAGRAGSYAARKVTAAQRDLLAAFEEVVVLDGTLYCHGSPRSDEEIITALTPPERLARMLDGVAEQLVVCGHTHHQFVLELGATRVVNAGSVGMPYEGIPGAYWLLVRDGEPEPRQTRYDADAAEAAIRATGYPEADDLVADCLRGGVAPDEAARVLEGFATSE
jgi:putative phosphoesterase